MTRKLIKPDLNEIKKFQKKDLKKKPPPPYKTHAENYYYIKQMNNHTPMVVELVNGEVLHGRIEWYDERCIKVKREDNSNFIVFKHIIKYMYKNPEAEADVPEISDKAEKPAKAEKSLKAEKPVKAEKVEKPAKKEKEEVKEENPENEES